VSRAGEEERREETDLPQGARRFHRELGVEGDGHRELGWVEVLPRSLHSVADAPKCGAQEKIGHSGRDDGVGENAKEREEGDLTPRPGRGKRRSRRKRTGRGEEGDGHEDWRWVEMLPRSLRCVADVRAARTKEKIGHSGRDDGVRKRQRGESEQTAANS